MVKTSRVVAKAEPSIHIKLDHRAELQRQLDEVRLDISYLDVGGKERELYEANNEITGYEQRVDPDNKDQIDPRYVVPLERARKRAETASAALKAEREKFAALTDAINSLERELAQSRDGGGTSFEEVRAYQSECAAAQAEVARFESFLDEQRRILSDAQARMQPKVDRSAEWEDLAAKVALGEEPEKILKELDVEIDKQNQAVDDVAAKVLPIAEMAQAAIAGLERKLEAARGVLARLEAKAPDVYAMLLHSMSEIEGLRYVEHAKNLRDSYTRLLAIADVLRNFGRPAVGNVSAILHRDHHRIMIPLFRLAACQGEGYPRDDSLFFSGERVDVKSEREKLIEQLHALGVQI